MPLLLTAAAPVGRPDRPIAVRQPRVAAVGTATVEILPVVSNVPETREGTPHRQSRRRGNEVMIEFF